MNFCQSEKGKRHAQKIIPSDRYDLVKKWLDCVSEATQLKNHFSKEVRFDFCDLDDYLSCVQVANSVLSAKDFHTLKKGIQCIEVWSTFLNGHSNDFCELSKLSDKVILSNDILKSIEKIIDERGEIKDAASPELSKIRKEINKSEMAVRSVVNQALQKAKKEGLTVEDSLLTIREGRLVIPVKAEFKNNIQGFIHDESATGQTVFIEPVQVLTLNNRVKELRYSEKREIFYLLKSLSDLIRLHLPTLKNGSKLIGQLDFIYAKLRLSDFLHAHIPELTQTLSMQLIHAIHPLLYLSHKNTSQPIIPLNLTLDEENRILIISGPNAGGKSVALKTVVLLQYMLQCGLPVPSAENSKFRLFSSMFVDIGDAQSIEGDLSTYSAHLSSMKYFLDFSDNNTLFLIDEFGKGTDPRFGGAMAESILLELVKRHAMGVVTTHYQNIKRVGEHTKGLFNGAMKYDVESLTSYFEMEIGQPGSSYAFEIAGRMGLPKEIIEIARKKTGTSYVDYDQLLIQLEKEKNKYQQLSKNIENTQKELTQERQDYLNLKKLIEKEKKQIIKNAKIAAQNLMDDANSHIESAIREIKEKNADKELTKQIRVQLQQKKQQYKTEEQPLIHKPFQAGDTIKVKGQDTVGKILKINNNQIELLLGNIKSIVSINKIEHTTDTFHSRPPSQNHRPLGIDRVNTKNNFSHTLTIRGLRADEAMSKIDKFIDSAMLLGIDEVKIVHGKGHGILREMVRNYTKNHSRILSLKDEDIHRGGSGVTVITIR